MYGTLVALNGLYLNCFRRLRLSPHNNRENSQKKHKRQKSIKLVIFVPFYYLMPRFLFSFEGFARRPLPSLVLTYANAG